MSYIKTKIICSLLLLGIIITVLFAGILNKKYDRYTMFFKNSLNSKIEMEVRYVPVQNLKAPEVAFFEELMLSPTDHDLYSLSKPGLKLNSCFVKNNVLYADLPSSFLEGINKNMDADDLSFLFSKNVFTNFKNLESLCIFIDGHQVYELFKK